MIANRLVGDLVGRVGYTYVCLVETPSTILLLLVVHVKLTVLAKIDSVFDRVPRSKNRPCKP